MSGFVVGASLVGGSDLLGGDGVGGGGGTPPVFPASFSWTQNPAYFLWIDDVLTDAIEWHTSHAANAIGQATIVLPLPLAPHVVDNATVTINARVDTADDYDTVFLGFIRAEDRAYDDGGAWISVKAVGSLHLMEFRNNRDVAFAGGAGTSPALLVGGAGPVHLGNDTIGNYAEQAPRDTKFDALWTPAVDSSFVRLTGRYHGANNDLQDLTNPRITHYDRIEIRQGGKAKGYGVYEPHTDDEGASYDTEEEFGDVGGVWADFDITIAAKLSAGSTATARFISGYPPGGGRGDHEFQQVRRSTAAQMTAREIVRGLFKKRGFGGSSGLGYIVDEIVSYSGVVIRLGGNGFVDNGQIRIAAGDSFFGFVRRVANLFEYAVYDSPDGKVRVRAIRGTPPPTATVDAAFAEGADVFRVRRARDLAPTVNYWRVLGASGTDAEGTSFQYRSEPDPAAVPNNPNIPDAVGWSEGEVSDDLLVSDTLCFYVKNLKEANTMDGSTTVEVETWPRTGLQPGRVVTLDAPSVGVSGRVWLTGVRHDWTDAGYWQTLTCWTGAGVPLPEAPDDPDEDADDILPATVSTMVPWRPYAPRSGS